MRSNRTLSCIAVALLSALCIPTAQGQGSGKVTRFIVPYAAGAIADVVSRSVAEKISSGFGHPTIVDFRPGANGSIGTEYVAKSEPDGYTLLVATLSHVTNPSLVKNLPWHPTKDFAGVALLATASAVAVVPASIPSNNFKEFVEFAKRRPGELNYLSPGTGTSMHLNTELLNLVAGIRLTMVSYKGSAPGIPDLLSSRLAFAFLPIPVVKGYISTGKLKPLFVASPRRNPRLPNVPTAAEAGYPDAQVVSWFALVAPAGTPSARIAELNKLVINALASEDVQKRLEGAGADPGVPLTPNEIDAMLESESVRFANLIRDAKIQIQ